MHMHAGRETITAGSSSVHVSPYSTKANQIHSCTSSPGIPQHCAFEQRTAYLSPGSGFQYTAGTLIDA